MLRYTLFLLLITLAAGAVVTGIDQLAPGTFLSGYAAALMAYFFVLTFAFHYGLTRAAQGRPAVFVRYYMAATSAKLMIHLAVIVLFAITHKETAFRFILTFLPFYVLFTAFEVMMAFKQNRSAKG